jgi:hypothetical protein
MKFKVTTYFTCHFHFDPLSFNPFISLKKYNRVLIWARKGLIMQKTKFEDQIKNFKKYIIIIHSDL